MESKLRLPRVHWIGFSGVLALALSPLVVLAGEPPTTAPASIQTSYTNTALVPVSRLEHDSYDWDERHAQVLKLQQNLDPEIVLIGDSITHFWGGPPVSAQARGTKAWAATFGSHRVLNLGFGWDRTQNVLWRLDHGELDGTHPRRVVLNIGSNNFSGTRNARANTPAEIAEAISAICDRVLKKSPQSRITVMGVLPRGFPPTDYYRTNIVALNGLLAMQLAGKSHVTFLDISEQIVAKDGVLSRDLLSDGTHPTEAGYAIWGKALLAADVLE